MLVLQIQRIMKRNNVYVILNKIYRNFSLHKNIRFNVYCMLFNIFNVNLINILRFEYVEKLCHLQKIFSSITRLNYNLFL